MFVCHIPEKPSKPVDLQITQVLKDGVALQWNAPRSDGGSEIFNYVIEYRIEGGFKWLKSNEDCVPGTTYLVKNLKEDFEYEFRVSAENRAGVGPASDPTSPVKVQEQIGQ